AFVKLEGCFREPEPGQGPGVARPTDGGVWVHTESVARRGGDLEGRGVVGRSPFTIAVRAPASPHRPQPKIGIANRKSAPHNRESRIVNREWTRSLAFRAASIACFICSGNSF